MRAYSASSQEILRARDQLKDWAGEGLLSQAQYQQMQQETVSDLRRTNLILRLVLFLFTLIIVGAATALFFVVFLPQSETHAPGIFFLIFAALSYAAAELAISRARLYRYGIEEALAAFSVGFLCAGMQATLFDGRLSSSSPTEFLVPAAGAVFSLWLWHRFALPYASLAAMIFLVLVPGYWTSSQTAQHLIVAAFYSAGLIIVAAIRPRDRSLYLNHEFSIAEALLWLGVYVAINLQLSPVNLFGFLNLSSWGGFQTAEFSRPFYWTTWALTWCLPPVMIARGLRGKDRFVLGVGALAAVLTLITNKSYLGWPRHTWDPMLLGALLIGVALLLRRWLAHGPGEIRRGFTAQRLSGKDKSRINVGAAAFGLLSPNPITPNPQPANPDAHFGGGDSGGGGASSDF